MGKYDAVLENLKAAPVADQKYQDKVNEAKSLLWTNEESGEIIKPTPTELAFRYAQLRTEEEELEAKRYDLQVKLTAMEQMIASSWEADEEGWGLYGASPNTLRMRDGAAVVVEQVPEGKVEDKEAFRLWCVAPADKCMVCGQPEGDAHNAVVESAKLLESEQRAVPVHEFKPGGGLEKKLQLWPSTMNAIAKERCQAGVPPPDGVSVYARTTVKFRKG